MQKETRQITVPAYRDKDGNPSCMGDCASDKICPFYRLEKHSLYSMSDTCFCAKTFPKLQRRDNGRRTLIPHAECPIWAWAE